MREAIDSALSQTYDSIEIIVVNDGSDDDGRTREIAESYGDRIRYIEKENGGVSSALNEGIRSMKGDYFSWLSHDDVYTPDKIQKQIEALRLIPSERAVVYCRCSLIDSASRPIRRKSKSDMLPTELLLEPETVLRHLFRHGSMNGCCFLIPKEVFAECGLFDERLRYAQDVLMWYRVFLADYQLYVVRDIGVLSRVHSQQQTQTGRSRYRADSLKICNEVLPGFLSISSRKKNLVLLYAMHHAMRGNKDVVNACRSAMRAEGLYSPLCALRLKAMQIYGGIRPMFRRLYYRLFRKIKTE